MRCYGSMIPKMSFFPGYCFTNCVTVFTKISFDPPHIDRHVFGQQRCLGGQNTGSAAKVMQDKGKEIILVSPEDR